MMPHTPLLASVDPRAPSTRRSLPQEAAEEEDEEDAEDEEEADALADGEL